MKFYLKSIKCVLLVELACLFLQALSVDCASTRVLDLSFLNSPRSDRLASLTEKLDFDQTKELLQKMRRAPSKEMLTDTRIKEFLDLSNAINATVPGCKKIIPRIEVLLWEYKAFPNIVNYLEQCKNVQLEACRQQS